MAESIPLAFFRDGIRRLAKRQGSAPGIVLSSVYVESVLRTASRSAEAGGLTVLGVMPKLFFSNSFDFTGMGPQLTKRLLRELQASIGFYEVQTGQSINQLCCTQLPAKVSWLQRTLADVLGMKVHAIDNAAWLKSMGIEVAEGVQVNDLPPIWTSLLCLMGEYKGSANEAAA